MALLPSFFMVQLALAPLPAPLIHALNNIEVESAVDGAAMFRLNFDLSRTTYGDLDALAIDLFRPLVPIRISVSFGLGVPMTLINGYVRDVQLTVGATPGSSRLEVVGADALATIMGHIQVPFPWSNVPDSEIASTIFGKYAIVPVTFATPLTRTIMDTPTVQQSRDNTFLRQIAAFHGYSLYIQPDPIAGIDIGYFRPLSVMMALPPQGVLSVDFGSRTNLNSFRLTNQMLKPTTIVSVFPDPVTRAPVPVIAAAAAEMPMGLEPSLFRMVPPPVEFSTAGSAANVAEKYLRAYAKVTEEARSVTASGEVDGLKYTRPLVPGMPVTVRGAGIEHSGLYFVTSVSHRISRDGYIQSFQALRNAVTMSGLEPFVDPLAPAA